MFDFLAPRYDLFNSLGSFSLDKYWRMRAIRCLQQGERILDVCTGTGQLAFEIERKTKGTVIGIDFSSKMLRIARQRLSSKVEFLLSKAENTPFRDDSFDCVISSFSMRNMVKLLPDVLKEWYRIVRTGGRIVILEIGNPETISLRVMYRFYLRKILPIFGKLLYGKRKPFYYLAQSIISFRGPQEFKQMLEKIKFKEVRYFCLTRGIAVIYTGIK